MAIFTYKIQDGVFVTTDIEPETWIEKYPVTVDEEILIKDGAMLQADDGILTIITDSELIIQISEAVE